MELLWVALFLGVWILLQVVVLPRLGIPTCLSGRCGGEEAARRR